MALANYRKLERKDLDILYIRLLIEKGSIEWDLQVSKLVSQHDIEAIDLETSLFLVDKDIQLVRLWYKNRNWELPKINL